MMTDALIHLASSLCMFQYIYSYLPFTLTSPFILCVYPCRIALTMRRHNPPYPSILLAMTATVLLLLHTHSALALSPNQSNPLWMYSAVTEEVGTGVGSLNFNAPYHSIRAIASLSSLSSRYTFNLQPFIPVTASLQSFNWELSTPPAEFPPWLTFIGSWVESSEFVLGFNATTLFSTLPPIDPPPFVIQLTGTVYYTHGPQRYIEQETRLLNLIVHYHVYRPLFERSTMLSPFTSSQQSNSITLYVPIVSLLTISISASGSRSSLLPTLFIAYSSPSLPSLSPLIYH